MIYGFNIQLVRAVPLFNSLEISEFSILLSRKYNCITRLRFASSLTRRGGHEDCSDRRVALAFASRFATLARRNPEVLIVAARSLIGFPPG